MKTDMKTTIVGFVLLFIGLATGGAAAMLYRSSQTALAGQRVAGRVVKLEQRRGGGGRRGGSVPVVQYDVAGQTHQIKGHVSTSPPAHRVGDTVRVVYPADSPQSGRIDSFVEMWLLPLVFGAIGAVLGLAGAGTLAAAYKNRPRREPADVFTVPDHQPFGA
jgi:hypothetical protein